jgi:tetratricopeptide (TPR) repeat protein
MEIRLGMRRSLPIGRRRCPSRPLSGSARRLGRAYFALGQYVEAKIEFETVLSFDNLPPDLESQAQIYDQAAAQYLEEGRRLTSFG